MTEGKPIDVIMWAGEEHYTVGSFIREAEQMGVSKRIPATAIPEGIVPGQSRILIKHRQAILQGENLEQFFLELQYVYQIPEEWTQPEGMLFLVMFLEDLKISDPVSWESAVEKYELTWTPGVIGYSYITSIQYITQDFEDDLPEELSHLEGYVEPIRMEVSE